MNKFDGPIIFATYDTELIEQVSNRLVYIDMDGTYLDKQMNYEEFVNKYNKI